MQLSDVRSLTFLTPTPFLLSLNIFRLSSNQETFASFALQLLIKLEMECYKLFKKCSKNDPDFTPGFRENINSGSTRTFEIH